jgi:hypothetical protein
MGLHKKLVLFGNTLEEARNYFIQCYNQSHTNFFSFDHFEYTGEREYLSTGQYNDKNRLIWIPKYKYLYNNITELVMEREPHEIEDVNYLIF